MIANELLAEKWKTQEKLAKIVGYSIKKMLDNAEKMLQELQEKYGFKIKKTKRKPDKDQWDNLVQQNFAKAYSEDEPEYTINLIKEPNAEKNSSNT